MTAPIPVRVLRHKCPFCTRTHSRPGRAREHISRCWYNPGTRGCMTCKHFTPRGWNDDDSCAKDVDLEGRPACPACGGYGLAGNSAGASVDCGPHFTPDHIGDGHEVKPGPITGCDLWEGQTS